ncbi:DMT family transporter [Rhodoluna sp.]|uniref:DMT family transporter n=1 Tax=Rhodoluna sp. TaxID=1969481 RepID=UPI0025DB30A6|nr:DMT family transporter [Rhodoluna sp.]
MKQQSETVRGYLLSFFAIIGFGFTFIAVTLGAESFDPITMSIGRVVPAGILSVIALKAMKQPILPPREAYPLIIGSSLGVIIGFPLLSTLALQTVPAADAGVIGALTPMVTAIVAVFIGHKKPRPMFWAAAALGAGGAMALAYFKAGGEVGGGAYWGYIALAFAVLFASMGHISGSTLVAKYSSFAVLSWAVIISIPVQLPIAIVNWSINPITEWPTWPAILGYLFVSWFSLSIGNFMLNQGLHTIGLVKGAQLQLLQPIVTMILSILVLHKAVSPITWIAAALILTSVAWSQRFKTK